MQIFFSDSDITEKYHYKQYCINNIEIKYVDEKIGFGLFTTKDINSGELVYSLPTVFVSEKTDIIYKMKNGINFNVNHEIYLTNIIETDDINEELYEFTYFDIFINSSCNPNCYYLNKNSNLYTDRDIKDQLVVALKNIKKGEQLFVDYDGLDWINLEPFVCKCNEDCNNIKQGFSFLSLKKQIDYIERGIVTDYVLKKYNNSA